MTTLCMQDFSPDPGSNVAPLRYTTDGRARGLKLAVYLAARRRGLPISTCLAIRDRAVRRYRAAECSPAMAASRAEAEARQAAFDMAGGAA